MDLGEWDDELKVSLNNTGVVGKEKDGVLTVGICLERRGREIMGKCLI